MRMDDLTAAFSTGILSSAKVFGVSIQSVGAAIATMTNAGIPAVDAATKLNSAIRLMAAPTTKAAKELDSIGLSSTKLASDLRSPGGVLTAVTDLQAHLTKAGLTATQQAALLANAFGGKQSLGVLTLIGSLGKLGTIQKEVTAGAGSFDAAWKATEATTKEQGAQIDASISTVKDAIGIGLLPAVNSLLHSVLPAVQGLAMWASQNPHLASTILLVVGGVAALAAGIAFLGPILGGIGAAMGVITSPILLVVAAVVALAAHFGLFGQGAKSAVDGVVGKITSMFPQLKPVFDALGNAMQWIASNAIPMLTEAFNYVVTNVIPALGEAFQWVVSNVLPALGDAFNWIVTNIFPPVEDVINTITTVVLPALGEAFSGIVTWVQGNMPEISAVFGAVAADVGKAAGVIGTVVKTAFDIVAGVIKTVSPILVDIGKVVFPAIGTAASAMLAVLQGVFDALGTAIDVLKTVFDNFGKIMSPLWDAITSTIQTASTAIMAVLQPIIDAMKWVIDNAGNILFTKAGAPAQGPGVNVPLPTSAAGIGTGMVAYQTGGVVPGSGPQLAIVHGGETVLPPGMSAAYGYSGVPNAPALSLPTPSPSVAPPAAGFPDITKMVLEGSGGVTGATAASTLAARIKLETAQNAVTSAQNALAKLTAGGGLAGQIKLQAAQNAVTNAHNALTKAEQEHATKTRTAADIQMQVAADQQRLKLATERLTLLHQTGGASATQLQTAQDKLTLAQQKLALVQDQVATGTTGTTTGTTTTKASTTASNASLTAALAAFTAALVRAVSSGVPITLDGQTIGDMIDRNAYTSASTATSGFVATGSIG
jgi:hypothetical protein